MSISERAKPKRPKCHICGCSQELPDERRSVPHLKRYFAMTRVLYSHWPINNDRQFSSSEELRKFLQMKAGHREIAASIPLSGIRKEQAEFLVTVAVRAVGSYAFPTFHKDQIIIWKPKSIAFDKMSHMEAIGLFAEVEDVIRAETGLDPAQLMQEHEGAA
jgi:hypothetical protein